MWCSSPKLNLSWDFFSSLLIRHQILFFMVLLSLFLEFWKYICTAFQARMQLNRMMATARAGSQLEASPFQIRNKDTLDNIKAELISPYEKQCALAKVHCLTQQLPGRLANWQSKFTSACKTVCRHIFH